MALPRPTAQPQITGTAGDLDQEYSSPNSSRLLLQISNQAVYITFFNGSWGVPEYYLPTMGVLFRSFERFKVRAAIPLANVPAGQGQAYVSLTACQ